MLLTVLGWKLCSWCWGPDVSLPPTSTCLPQPCPGPGSLCIFSPF